MKIARVVHQQIFQIRWQLLACLGLIMVLPFDEAVINLIDGAGFYSETAIGFSIAMSPFLAGLIACANVQADLDEKRCVFWMSKPVGIKSFITMKYFVGLVLVLFLFGCPILFAIVSGLICNPNEQFSYDSDVVVIILIATLISLLTYSLCFLCNVLVRKTARAWLIGITATGFLLLVPFMLPLNFRDITTDIVRLTSSIYVVVFAAVILGAFVVSLFAVKHNWHVQTNLKGLFWAFAVLAFILMMMFSRQVANIKVLDEVKTDSYHLRRYSDGRVGIYDKYIKTEEGSVKFEDIGVASEEPVKRRSYAPLYEVEEGLYQSRHPRSEKLFYRVGDDTYTFRLMAYYRKEKNQKGHDKNICTSLYLCSYKKLIGHSPIPVDAIEMSEFIENDPSLKVAMRMIEDKLVVFANDSYATLIVKDTGKLKIVDKKIDAFKSSISYRHDRNNMFKIPLIDVEGISIEEQIKLTIDINYSYSRYGGWCGNLPQRNLVDIYENEMSFAIIEGDITKYDIVKWDEEFVYCKYRDARHFTFLEQMFGNFIWDSQRFIKDGKLYVYNENKLMVFDVRSERIRKLGHFERMSEKFRIRDVEVMQDGDILMTASIEIRSPENRKDWTSRSYLYLLKNPE